MKNDEIEDAAYSMGPVAKPSTYNEMPSMPTSVLTPKASATEVVAAEKILLANAAIRVV